MFTNNFILFLLLLFSQRGAHNPRKTVPPRSDGGSGPLQARPDRNPCAGRRQNCGSELPDRAQALRGQLDGIAEDELHRQGAVRRGLVPDDT